MSIDDNYVWPFLISAYSAKKYYLNLSRIILVVDKTRLSVANMAMIKKISKHMQIRLDFVFIELSNSLSQNLHISINAYAKIYYALKSSRNFVWIDSDTLLQKNWNLIFQNLEKPFLKKSILVARPHWETLSISTYNMAYISSKRNYFNAGVCIINPKKFKLQFSADYIEDIYNKYEELNFQWSDQCVLNYLMEGIYDKLDKTFNSTPDEYISSQTRIIHFIGLEKPWTSKHYKEGLISSQNNSSGYIFSAKDEAFNKYFLVEEEFVDFLESRELDAKTRSQMQFLIDQSNVSPSPPTTLT